jgi:hypothetical protein
MDDEKILVDGRYFALNELSKEAKDQVNNLLVVDQKIANLQQELAILQTARNAYAVALATSLPKS